MMRVGTSKDIMVTQLGAHREPQTTWIKSQACRVALRVSSSDMATRDCLPYSDSHPRPSAPPIKTHTSHQETTVSQFEV